MRSIACRRPPLPIVAVCLALAAGCDSSPTGESNHVQRIGVAGQAEQSDLFGRESSLRESLTSTLTSADFQPPASAKPTANPLATSLAVPRMKQSPTDRSAVVRIFYGTNRRERPDASRDWNDFYGSGRGDLQYGVCAVSLPPSHSYGEIERPSIWRFEFKEDSNRHVMLRQIRPVTEDRFTAALRSVTAEEDRNEAFVFVHGYNNDFAEAARRTAQIKHDLNFPGPAILFSWPSQGSARGYNRDREQITPSLPELTRFLQLIARDSGAKRVHVIAHSMGNEFATRALAQIGSEAIANGRPETAFDQLVLAAPDIDAAEFATRIAPYLRPSCTRCTIYAADHDLALAGSQRLNRTPRLGQAGRYLVTFPSMPFVNVVDASKVDFDLFNLGHADFSDELLADIRGVLAGLGPDRRHLRPHQIATAWQFVPSEFQPVSFEVDEPDRPVRIDEPAETPVPADDEAGLWASVQSWWPF